MPARLEIRKAAVLGAGVMGAQIAAQLTNAGIETLLFDLPAEGGDERAIAREAIARLAKLSPSPLAEPRLAGAITPADYDDDIEALVECDLVIEAIAERLELKRALFERIAPYLNERAMLASNTSGLSIAAMAATLPAGLRARFCAMHFFNPPRYMTLVELIPCSESDPALLDRLESFLVSALGKGVVRAKDTPNFIGNRIGVFSMLSIVHHAQRLGLGFDEVDALTGPALGRPRSATYRTLDVVGLDTIAHVIATMRNGLPDDPWHRHFSTPAWAERLIERGALGQKNGAGCYRKRAGQIEVLDPDTFEYGPARATVAPEVAALLALEEPGERLEALRASHHPQAQLVWSSLRDLFHYCAAQLEQIADHAFDLDLALRWGYGWKRGPFESWQAAGWKRVAGWIEEEIAQGKTMSDAPLPAWVTEVDGVYRAGSGYAPATGRFEHRGELPVYTRQRAPERLLDDPLAPGETVFENAGLRAWHDGDGVLVASFTTKGHVISADVLAGVRESVAIAERDFDALVLWHPEAPFSYGADLKGAMAMLAGGERDAFSLLVAEFQRTSQTLKYSMVPVIAAIQGMTLGGGCELQMHCARTVAELESYVGLVEAGVGLLPAGGGLKEFALRAANAQGDKGDLFTALAPRFERVARALPAGSAREAQGAGLLRDADVVVMNPFELLHVARHQARALFEAGYRPPLPARTIRVAGRPAIANFDAQIINLLEGRSISEHDAEIAHRIAVVLCGGEVDADERVDEAWLLGLEREHFVQLAMSEKTQARIQHTLKTGKPLRN
ncbi:3-hydroxyacyl-CoA dehydrogenase/enoyl-CoA hydratase family protein [Halotalea alkalilenta]|uniref:3-hydroxyacyl-CoA dehydrogenase/enoyl-CoA hydratase family protein n=1 Tax=Halotalea alkalilenta TaxID=376489 RepID=UPI00047F0ED4|nr:3-hydroxyacyl-CoA dehydrogenase/enoyl-CoA hydratase family protein [Halotalea alkalilenta]